MSQDSLEYRELKNSYDLLKKQYDELAAENAGGRTVKIYRKIGLSTDYAEEMRKKLLAAEEEAAKRAAREGRTDGAAPAEEVAAQDKNEDNEEE